MNEAKLYEKLDGNKVHCYLCAHHCRINDGARGLCRVRENRGGTLYTLVYGKVIAQQIDPIEKKPLYHFYPGSRSYSIATRGCNFRCQWCQNSEIAQMPDAAPVSMGIDESPAEIVAAARAHGCKSISYTYTEPTIFFEYSADIARQAHAAGVANVFVTNGYMTEQMLDEIHPFLDAANVDLKSFSDDVYRQTIGGRLAPVLASLKKMKSLGIWTEVTTLIIPELNDDPQELRDLCQFLVCELGPDTPWHISRFHPANLTMDRAPTPFGTLEMARETGIEAGLKYVYLGNTGGEANTDCPGCGRVLVRRAGFSRPQNALSKNGICPDCGTVIPGVGLAPV